MLPVEQPILIAKVKTATYTLPYRLPCNTTNMDLILLGNVHRKSLQSCTVGGFRVGHACTASLIYSDFQVGSGTRLGLDNHNLYMIEFLDYRNVQCCGQLCLHELTFNSASVPQPHCRP